MAHILGDQHEDDRNEHRKNREISLRQMELRQTDPSGAFHRLEIDLTASARVRVTDQHAQQDVQTPDQAAEQHTDQQDGDQRHHRGIRSLLEVRPHDEARLKPMMATIAPLTTGGMICRSTWRRRNGRAPPAKASQTGDHDAEAGDRDTLVGDRPPRSGDEAEGATKGHGQALFLLMSGTAPSDDGLRNRSSTGRNGVRFETVNRRRDDMLGADARRARPTGRLWLITSRLALLRHHAVSM